MHFCTYHHFAFEDVLGFPVGIFHLFAQHQIQFEEENVPIFALANDLLGIDDVERILQNDFAQSIVSHVAAFQHGQVEGVVGFLGHVEAHFEAFLDLPSIAVGTTSEQVFEQ